MRRHRAVFLSSTRTRPRMCPVCKTMLDAATGMQADSPLESPHPKPGNITLCGVCISILVATATGFRVAGESELKRLDPDMRRVLLELQQRLVERPAFASPFGGSTS